MLICYRILVLKKVWRVNSVSYFGFEKSLEIEIVIVF